MNQKVVSNPISKNKTGTYPNAQQPQKESEQWLSHSSENEQSSAVRKNIDES